MTWKKWSAATLTGGIFRSANVRMRNESPSMENTLTSRASFCSIPPGSGAMPRPAWTKMVASNKVLTRWTGLFASPRRV